MNTIDKQGPSPSKGKNKNTSDYLKTASFENSGGSSDEDMALVKFDDSTRKSTSMVF
jgi:hypothetical protein